MRRGNGLPRNSEVEVLRPTRIKLERYGAERVFRWRSRKMDDSEGEGRTYGDVKEEIRDDLEPLAGGGGRSVYKLPSEAVNSGGCDEFVVKLAGPRSEHTGDSIPVSEGFVQNWREILISRYNPVMPYIVPVVDASPNGLWLVMPLAKQEGIEVNLDRIDELASEVESIDGVEPVMGGHTSSRPDVYWSENWGAYSGEYRLLDYGGIALTASVEQPDYEFPFVDPAKENID